MKRITCSVCGRDINSLDELVTCSTGLFKVGAFHDYCFEKRNRKNNIVIFKPGSMRILHIAAILFTIFASTIMITFRSVSFITVFSVVGILVLDIYVFLSFSKIERFVGNNKYK